MPWSHSFKNLASTLIALLLTAWPTFNVSADYLTISPNEYRVIHALPLLVQAPRGVYIAVGTERGFMGAALCPEAEHLWLVDINPLAHFFNQINIALLAAASDRADYLHLRLEAAWPEWQDRLKTLKVSEIDFLRWDSAVRKSGDFGNFHDPSRTSFNGANYLHDDLLFLKLNQLAKNSRIRSYHMDLSKVSDAETLATNLRREDLTASVVDLSNTWWSSYIGPTGIETVVNALMPVASPQTVLILTQYVDFFNFGYFGASFGKLRAKIHMNLLRSYFARMEGHFVHSESALLPQKDRSTMNVHLLDSPIDIQELNPPFDDVPVKKRGVRSWLTSIFLRTCEDAL